MSEILDRRDLAPEEESFSEIVRLIDGSRSRALQAVNTVLIDLYWQIGEFISRRLAASEWGEGTIDRLAQFIAKQIPGVRGFSRPNLFRMKQFYEAYKDNQIVSSLVRQLRWSHHLIILGQGKRPEEREFLTPHGRSRALVKETTRTSVQIRSL